MLGLMTLIWTSDDPGALHNGLLTLFCDGGGLMESKRAV